MQRPFQRNSTFNQRSLNSSVSMSSNWERKLKSKTQAITTVQFACANASKPECSRAWRRNRLSLALASGLLCMAFASPSAYATPADTMIKAIKFDDIKEVDKQLANGTDPNLTDPSGMPILVLAAREKSDKVAAALIANPKIDLEKADAAGENAMMLAALNGDANLVKLLISKDAGINKTGWTPLHYAATNGHDDVVQLLIDHSADINAASPNGTTPLMMAARGNHVTTVKMLLAASADPSLKNQLGLSALDFAKRYAAKDAMQALTPLPK
jgi:ankyrin repeat protein